MAHYSEIQRAALEEFQADIGHLNALAGSSRQRLLMSLGTAPDKKGLTVSELAETIGLSQPATSHHLKVLREIGMVGSHHEGNIVYYYLTLGDTIDRLERLAQALRKQQELDC
ncbi:ArsR/SmtB family transcription factor [Lacticaseibacillus sp. GG6-2]